MKKSTIEQFITKLDNMIATIQQAIVLGDINEKEREACELLKNARLNLIEDFEAELESLVSPIEITWEQKELDPQYRPCKGDVYIQEIRAGRLTDRFRVYRSNGIVWVAGGPSISEQFAWELVMPMQFMGESCNKRRYYRPNHQQK
jgi:hypothetical protein